MISLRHFTLSFLLYSLPTLAWIHFRYDCTHSVLTTDAQDTLYSLLQA